MNKRKYLQKSATPHPHVGAMVLRVIREKKLSKAAVARMLNVTPSTLANYFEQSSIQFGILWNLSVALEYDFLGELANYYPPTVQPNAKNKTLALLTAAEEKIQLMETQISIYERALKIN